MNYQDEVLKGGDANGLTNKNEFNAWVNEVNEEERITQTKERWRKKNMPKYSVGEYEEVQRLSAPLPAGVYEVEVFDGEERTSKAGSPMFSWTLRVVNNDNPDFNGQQLFYNTPLEGKGRLFLQQLFEGCGVRWKGQEVDLPEDLLGRVCVATVNNYIYEGKQQAGVKSILPRS